MLSEQELDTLYGEVNRPYSPKELTAHLADREVKSALEATHAHNLELIAQVQRWIDFLGGKGPRPENKLWRLLMPGTNEENPACFRLETITEYFARFGHGDTPRQCATSSARVYSSKRTNAHRYTARVHFAPLHGCTSQSARLGFSKCTAGLFRVHGWTFPSARLDFITDTT